MQSLKNEQTLEQFFEPLSVGEQKAFNVCIVLILYISICKKCINIGIMCIQKLDLPTHV